MSANDRLVADERALDLSRVCGYVWDEPESRGGGVGFACMFRADAQLLASPAPVRPVVRERRGGATFYRVFESGEYRSITEPEHLALRYAHRKADQGGWCAWWPNLPIPPENTEEKPL